MHFVLRRFRDRAAEYEDLFQYGCMGLIKAIDRFDASYGVRFSTYAVPVILGEVRRYLRDNGTVHVSRTIHDNSARIERYRQEYRSANNREPSFAEIGAGTGLDDESVLLAMNACARVRSLSEPVDGEGSLRLMDVIRGEDSMETVDSRLMLKALLQELNPEERSIIIRRYFRRHTQTQIAKDMGISQVQVSRLEGKILKRMRSRAAE